MNAFTKLAIAKTHPDPPAIEIKVQVPGTAVVFLADGTALVGVISAATVRKRIGAKDAEGNDVYDIDWNIQGGTVKK